MKKYLFFDAIDIPSPLRNANQKSTFLDRFCFAFCEPVLLIFLSTRNRVSIAYFKKEDLWLKVRFLNRTRWCFFPDVHRAFVFLRECEQSCLNPSGFSLPG